MDKIMGLSKWATAGSAIQPKPSEAMVIPSWQADREASKRSTSQLAVEANGRLSLTISSIRLSRIFTKANSAATKNPFISTSNPANKIIKMSYSGGVI